MLKHLQGCFLIHRRAFKESSLLLDFFTQEHGKIRLVGRGLRKSKTPLQMFKYFTLQKTFDTLTRFGANEL
jgi:DNA repair protein RecO (recombination protein O)